MSAPFTKEMPMSAMTPAAHSTKAQERQARNQGFADGLKGAARRRSGDATYSDGYRRGTEKRLRTS